jgi:hypothetical protein
MKIAPCNNCERESTCEVPAFLRRNAKLGVFVLADMMVRMPVTVSIISLNKEKTEAVLECDAVVYVNKPRATYEALLNSKPCDSDCCIGAALKARCKNCKGR